VIGILKKQIGVLETEIEELEAGKIRLEDAFLESKRWKDAARMLQAWDVVEKMAGEIRKARLPQKCKTPTDRIEEGLGYRPVGMPHD
jgi:hypothetical protein